MDVEAAVEVDVEAAAVRNLSDMKSSSESEDGGLASLDGMLGGCRQVARRRGALQVESVSRRSKLTLDTALKVNHGYSVNG
jgi:hypothetical protein